MTWPDALLERVERYGGFNGRVHLFAEQLDDIETTRIGFGHRLGQATKGPFDFTKAETDSLTATHDQLKQIEHQVILKLEGAMRRHPLYTWSKDQNSLGEKQFGRLIASIGNPYWNLAAGRPRRGPAELWAYCGYHVLPVSQGSLDDQNTGAGGQSVHPTDHRRHGTQRVTVGGVAPRRMKGQAANWNSAARMRAYLIAEQCVKGVEVDTVMKNGKRLRRAASPYRAVYEETKAKSEGAIHAVECHRCGVCRACGGALDKNRTEHFERTGCKKRLVDAAPPGSLLSDGHRHARAVRVIAKAVLRDVFVAAREWHLAGLSTDDLQQIERMMEGR